MSRFTLDDLPERYRHEVLRQLGGGKAIGVARAQAVLKTEVTMPRDNESPTTQPKPAKKRLRQDTKGPNKTEREFQDWLAGNHNGPQLHFQAVTLVLANGVRYTPDVFCFGSNEAWEVKGFMRDDAAVKIKVAARLFPAIQFRLVTKRTKKNGGGFAIEPVLP